MEVDQGPELLFKCHLQGSVASRLQFRGTGQSVLAGFDQLKERGSMLFPVRMNGPRSFRNFLDVSFLTSLAPTQFTYRTMLQSTLHQSAV